MYSYVESFLSSTESHPPDHTWYVLTIYSTIYCVNIAGLFCFIMVIFYYFLNWIFFLETHRPIATKFCMAIESCCILTHRHQISLTPLLKILRAKIYLNLAFLRPRFTFAPVVLSTDKFSTNKRLPVNLGCLHQFEQLSSRTQCLICRCPHRGLFHAKYLKLLHCLV